MLITLLCARSSLCLSRTGF